MTLTRSISQGAAATRWVARSVAQNNGTGDAPRRPYGRIPTSVSGRHERLPKMECDPGHDSTSLRGLSSFPRSTGSLVAPSTTHQDCYSSS